MLNISPTSEAERLRRLAELAVLDTPGEEVFDRITRLAARLFKVPIALVSLIDEERQWFKSCVGLALSETPRDEAFCNHAIRSTEVMVVPDARLDPRFKENSLVAGAAGFRFYAGAPLQTEGGIVVGTLCILDTKPRTLSEDEKTTLQELAAMVAAELHQRGTGPAKLARIEQTYREELEMRVQDSTLELAASAARSMAILETALDGIALVDQEGRILEFNPAAEQIFGVTRSAAIGQLLHELIISPALGAQPREALNCGMVPGEISSLNRRIEVRAHHADGREILVEMAMTRVASDGPPVFTAYLRDITERRANENELRMLQNSVFYANDDILITEAEPINLPGPRIIYVNRAFTEHTGYSAEEVMGKTPRILHGPKTTDESRQTIRNALEAWKPVRLEVINYRKDGSEFWSELNIVPVANEKGWFTHWVSIQRDITANRQARMALEQARDEAERANHAKSDFLSRMSHELRTPLNAILGFSQLLQNSPMVPRDKKGVDQIVKAGWHLLNLINEVLDVARIESGRIELSIESLSIREVLEEVRDLVSPLAEAAQVELIDGAGCEDSQRVLADHQRLKQTLLNLLSNGIKYNGPGGSVSMACCLAGERQISIAISDTGPGIAPDDLGKLFEPFERLGASTSIEGTGLGLTLSRRLIEAMEGTLTVSSVVGAGSVFTLTLPLAQPQNAAEKSEKSEIETRASETHTLATVLYIEDNLVNLQLVSRILEQRPGLKLLSALYGLAGLELAREHQPDVILLDLHLPDIDGYEVLRQLQLDPGTRNIPVLIVSADATPVQIERMRAAGASRYVTKPFAVQSFLSTLDTYLPQSARPDQATSS